MVENTPADRDAPVDAEPVPTAAQHAVVELPTDASALVVGAPGTGKTTALVARVRALIGPGGALHPDEVTVLTPSRQSASALRDRLALAVGGATGGSLAHSVPSFCFRLIRQAAVDASDPAPVLLTGADEDSLLRDLLDAHERDEASIATAWPSWLSPEVRATKGFRSEARAFFAQCTTLGVGPEQLAALAEREGEPVWSALSILYRELLRVRGVMRPAHRDAAGLVTEAAALVGEGVPVRIGGSRRGLRVVLIDDAQELTSGAVGLVERLRLRGVSVIAFADPDVSSGAFRGATPDAFARLLRALPSPIVMDEPLRSQVEIVDLTRSLTAHIGTSGVASHRRAPTGEVGDGLSVSTMVAGGPAEEFDAIARLLRERHLRDRVPWGRCAVIAHDARQVQALQRELAAREVPTGAAGTEQALGALTPVRDLLAVLDLALADPDQWEVADVSQVLCGVAGGFDPIRLRRLRTALRHAELDEDGSRSGSQLLVSGMRHPVEFDLVDTPDAQDAARIARTVAAVRGQRAEAAGPHELLWTVWERSGLARSWARAAAGTGPLAQQAGRDLDAVVALFQAAKRFGERAPDAGSAVPRFIRGILTSEVADDRLEAAVPAGAVSVMTPAAALAREFDTVVIAGVQDGVWPNTRPRGGLLGQWRLSEAVVRADAEPSAPADRRRAVMHDELRLFVRAISRARARVVVTAVDNDQSAPSVLFEFLPTPRRVEQAQAHPLSLRGLVAQHRRTLTDPACDDPVRERAASQLALLAAEGVPGADPDQWYGVAGLTTAGPLYEPGHEKVRVSPSRLATMQECELNWVIGQLGGDTSRSGAGVGTLVHAALETSTGSDEEALWRVVEQRWGELEFDAPWIERANQGRARKLIGSLASYLARFEASDGRVLGAESSFELELPGPGTRDGAVVLRGTIDRVELRADGTVMIVDLKTGTHEKVSAAAIADNPQLGAYQLAVASGAVPAAEGHPFGGAKLLVLHTEEGKKRFVEPTQEPFDAEQREAFTARVHTAATVMRSAGFHAPFEEHCRDEHSHGLCRIHTVGAVSAA